MVNADLNVVVDINITQSHPEKKDRHYHKVNHLNKGTVHFKIFHQNMKRLREKPKELLCRLRSNFCRVLCLTEHHLKCLRLEKVCIENYNLGAHYCRQLCEKGGAAIFIHNSLSFSNIDIAQHCKEQDIEMCTLKLSFGSTNICVLTLYRAPSGNFGSFLLKLNAILQSLYTPWLQFIICRDININYLNVSENKYQLDNLLLFCNLTSIINFPTRVENTSITAVDNIFIDVFQLESYTATSIINDMSEHDAQLLIINTDYSHVPIHTLKTIKKINKYTIYDFIDELNCESWDSIFNSEDINTMFNSFLNIYLRIFYSSFPLKQ